MLGSKPLVLFNQVTSTCDPKPNAQTRSFSSSASLPRYLTSSWTRNSSQLASRKSFASKSLRSRSVFGRCGAMSSPAEFYNSLPPITKAYGTICVLATTAFQLGLYHPVYIALIYDPVFSRFEVWRLLTNFFFLGKFSINFGIRLLMLARYGVQLEKGPFEKRTADFLWMIMFGACALLILSAIPLVVPLYVAPPFLGVSLVFMLLYLWSREFPNAQINIYGLVTLKAFYLPWAMLVLDVIFGSPISPDLLGIVAGHMYYFFSVLYPLSGGPNLLRTPRWVHKLVARMGLEGPSYPGTAQGNRPAGTAFRGRGYRLNQ